MQYLHHCQLHYTYIHTASLKTYMLRQLKVIAYKHTIGPKSHKSAVMYSTIISFPYSLDCTVLNMPSSTGTVW